MRDSKQAERSSAIHRQRNKHSRPRTILSGLGLFLFVFFLIYGSIFIMVPAVLSAARETETVSGMLSAYERPLQNSRVSDAADDICNKVSSVSITSGPSVSAKNLEVIILSSYSETMRAGERKTISASTPGGIPVIWESDDPKVAAVDQSGRVTARRRGKALIIVKTGNARAVCKIRVKKADKKKHSRAGES